MGQHETIPNDLAAGRWREFSAGWRPLVATSFGLGLGLSPIPAYTAGIMAVAMEKQFGWSRGEIMGTLMLTPIFLVILGRHVGRLVDTQGPRKVALISTVGLGIAQLLLAAIGSRLALFYIGWAVMAVVALGTLPLTYAKVINSWFKQARGLALGIALSSSGVSGALLPLFLNNLIGHYGWRAGYLGLAALPLLIALPVLFFWLHMPTAPALEADAKVAPQGGSSVHDALRSPRFWTLAGATLALSFAVGGLMPNLLMLMLDRGIDKTTATGALSALAISVTAGRLISGFLLDRLWAPLVAAILILPTAGALCMLANPAMSAGVMAGSVVTIGLLGGAEFDLIAILTGRYFGQRHFSELYGIQFAVFAVGAGFAPATYGALHDRLGSYTPTIYLSVGLLVAATGLFLSLGGYPRADTADGQQPLAKAG